MLTTVETEDDITLTAILDEWAALEFDFQHVLHIDLDAARHSLSWRRFVALLGGLFATEDSLIRRTFRPDPDPGSTGPKPMED